MNEAQIVLNGPVVVLCEGQHDAAFLHAVAGGIGHRTTLDLPFFEQRNGRWQGRTGFAHGGSAMAGQLRSVALQLRASPNDTARIKRILLLRDCGDDAAVVRRETAAACREAGLPVPEADGAWHGPENQPRTALLLLLPSSQERGSLETLCLDYPAFFTEAVSRAEARWALDRRYCGWVGGVGLCDWGVIRPRCPAARRNGHRRGPVLWLAVSGSCRLRRRLGSARRGRVRMRPGTGRRRPWRR